MLRSKLAMNYAGGYLIIPSFVYLLIFSCQQVHSSHRTDVYIAGFFPYGFGVENSDTGKLPIPF